MKKHIKIPYDPDHPFLSGLLLGNSLVGIAFVIIGLSRAVKSLMG